MVCNTERPVLYVTARNPPAQLRQVAKMTTQPEPRPNLRKDETKRFMEG